MRYIRDVLNEINNTWRYPAQELTKAGVKGTRNDMRHCPIAEYLKQEGDPVKGLEVDETVIWYEDDTLQMFTFENQMVIAFMEEFDKGQYPELINE